MYSISVNVACSKSTMVGIYRLAERASQMSANVLIVGESGVGKEYLAREIHRFNDPGEKGFRVYPCYSSGINFKEIQQLLSSAPKVLDGELPVTVFLKSVEGINEKDQLKLLEALDEGQSSIDANRNQRTLKPRLICSSQKNIDKQYGENGLRPSLAYKLDVIHIEIPPLRERKQEILPLAELFLQEFKVKYRKKITGFSSAVREKLANYSWPGNVRELRNAVEEAVILTPGAFVENVNLS